MKIEFDEVCKSCGGTGLYIGMAERDGAAVVCHTCKGTGCHHFVHEYEEFQERIPPTKPVVRVYEVNPGVVIGKGSNLSLDDFGGMYYSQWKAGMPFSEGMENRKFTCPTWWYQTADYNKAPNWNECYSCLGRRFSRCPYFITKEDCWQRWDEENLQRMSKDAL